VSLVYLPMGILPHTDVYPLQHALHTTPHRMLRAPRRATPVLAFWPQSKRTLFVSRNTYLRAPACRHPRHKRQRVTTNNFSTCLRYMSRSLAYALPYAAIQDIAVAISFSPSLHYLLYLTFTTRTSRHVPATYLPCQPSSQHC